MLGEELDHTHLILPTAKLSSMPTFLTTDTYCESFMMGNLMNLNNHKSVIVFPTKIFYLTVSPMKPS